jgi:hypothetical protein
MRTRSRETSQWWNRSWKLLRWLPEQAGAVGPEYSCSLRKIDMMKAVGGWEFNNVAGLRCSYGTTVRRVAVQGLPIPLSLPSEIEEKPTVSLIDARHGVSQLSCADRERTGAEKDCWRVGNGLCLVVSSQA